MLAPGGSRGTLGILIYHRVLPGADALLGDDIDAAGFESQMAFLAQEFNVLPLGEGCERLVQGTLPARAVSITFDDGYADNEQIALPILKRHGLTATFFIATGYADGGVMFNDVVIEAVRRAPGGTHDLLRLGLGRCELSDDASRVAAINALLPQLKYRPVSERGDMAARIAGELGVSISLDLMMRPAQIRHLHDEGMEIGAHTVNHPILAVTGDREARDEIVESKRRLEDITGSRVRLFAYPNGEPGRDYIDRDVRLVREAGFAAAVSTSMGIARRASDLFQLPRFGPWDRTPRRMGLRLLAHCVKAAA
jgi:peptidoglycan/xylan/chitin deacetylase (PgdA/CDA1 family)